VLVALLASPGVAKGGEKVIGIGGSTALGAVFLSACHAVGIEFALDAGVEFRIHPVRAFSIDLNFDIAGTAYALSGDSNLEIGGLKVLFHIHTEPLAERYFSAGPYFGIGGVSEGGGTVMPIPQIGARIGGEVHSPGHDFALGLFVRPGFWLSCEARSFEIYFEMTWIFYPPIPRKS